MVPDGIDDPRRPSGGNVYDRRALSRACRARLVGPRAPVPGRWPRPDAPARAAVAAALARVPYGSLVLVDGLVASVVPEVLKPQAGRLRLVVLLHMPRDEPREVAALSAASAIVATSEWTRRWLSDHYALPGIPCTSCRPASTQPKWPRVRRLAGGCSASERVTPLKGHDLLLDALATVDDRAWHCICVGALDLDPEFVASPATAGRGQGPQRSGVLHRPAHGRRARPRVRRGGRSGAGLARGDLRHGRHRGACPRASGHREEVGGVPEALGHAADGSRPGLLVPPGDPQTLGQTLRSLARRPPGAGAAPRRGPVPATRLSDWAQPPASCPPCCPKSPGDRMNQQPVTARTTVAGYASEIGRHGRSAAASGPGRAWWVAPRSSPSWSGGWAPARSWTGSD